MATVVPPRAPGPALSYLLRGQSSLTLPDGSGRGRAGGGPAVCEHLVGRVGGGNAALLSVLWALSPKGCEPESHNGDPCEFCRETKKLWVVGKGGTWQGPWTVVVL